MSDQVTFEAEVESAHILGKDFWGRAIVRDAKGDRITVMGSMLGLESGESIRVRGVWTQHAKYGEQFKAYAIEPIRASTPNGAIAWLTKRLPRIGKKRAEAMVETWGVNGTWDVLDNAPERLAEIPGIRGVDVLAIQAAYRKHRSERDRMVALRDMGLTDNQAATATSVYGDAVVEKIRANPYDMIESVRGIGFKRADGIARTCGLDHDDPARIRAGVEHTLLEAAERGHTYVPLPKLLAVASRLLSLPDDIVEAEMYRLRQRNQLPGNRGRAQLGKLRYAERRIAGCVQHLLGAGPVAA